ncbi:MAG: TolC family protein [Polyangiales bacterium]
MRHRIPLLCAAALLAHAHGAAAQAPVPLDAPTPEAPATLEAPPLRPGPSVVVELGAGGLTADAAAELSVQHAPDMAQAAAATARAEAAYREARVGLFPQLQLQASYTRLSRVNLPPFDIGGGTVIDNPFPQILNNYLLRASVSVPVTQIFMSTLPGMRAASLGREAAELQAAQQERMLRIQGREAYFQLMQARARVTVAQQSVRVLEALVDTTRAMVERGVLARAELSGIQARLSSIRVVLMVAEGDAVIAEVALVQRIGGRAGDHVVLGEAAEVSDVSIPAALDAGQVDAALEARPEAAALRALVEVRRAEVRVHRGTQLPQVALVGAIDYANPNQRVFPQTAQFRHTWSLGVNVTWSPNAFAAGHHRAAGAEATLVEAEAQLSGLERAITIEVHQADAAVRAAAASIGAAREAVAAAQETYEARRLRYEAGAGTSNDVLDAEMAARQAEVDLVDAYINYRLAQARRSYALGVAEEAAP